MSELVDTYLEKIPERCRECPALEQYIPLARQAESLAQAACDDISNAAPDSDSPLSGLVRQARTLHLEIATDCELVATHIIENLGKGAGDCPGPKRGVATYLPFFWRLGAYIKNQKMCRNPGLYRDSNMETKYE